MAEQRTTGAILNVEYALDMAEQRLTGIALMVEYAPPAGERRTSGIVLMVEYIEDDELPPLTIAEPAIQQVIM